MLLYDRPFAGKKSFTISSMDRRPLSTLVKALKKCGAEDIYVVFDGSEMGEESFVAVRLNYQAVKNIITYERTGQYNFEMSQKGQKPKSYRDTA